MPLGGEIFCHSFLHRFPATLKRMKQSNKLKKLYETESSCKREREREEKKKGLANVKIAKRLSVTRRKEENWFT